MNLDFSHVLLDWYAENARELPWRKTRDPYKIWLSEIILQQTRVRQGLPYYLKFTAEYPTVIGLAAASEQEILNLWQGLGYYSRARNLLKAAQIVVREHEGIFPQRYEELLTLPGIGDYTASAIASICSNEPAAVLDGNVFRVLSRFYGIDLPIHSPLGKKQFKEKAQEILNTRDPGEHNQALMEFGALQCKPKNPNCEICPLRNSCLAYQTGRVRELPVKLKKTKIRSRYFNYLVFVSPQKSMLVQKRSHSGIWQNLYEFPLIETRRNISRVSLQENPYFKQFEIKEIPVRFYDKIVKHQLSHQTLYIKFWIVRLPDSKMKKLRSKLPVQQISVAEFEHFPVPIIIHRFLEDFI